MSEQLPKYINCQYCDKQILVGNRAHYVSVRCKKAQLAKQNENIDDVIITILNLHYKNLSEADITNYLKGLSVEQKINLKSNLKFLHGI